MAASFEFAPYRVDAGRRTLMRGGSEVALSRKAFDTLVVLLEERGNVVPKEVLIQRVWPDSFVEENSLNQTVSALRKVLGPKFIETVSGRGYRFVAPIVVNAAPPPETPRSLAVLPLRNLGAEEGDWLGIGIADTLITRLTNVRELAVRPTSAVLRHAQSDAVEAGRALGVDAVLEGNIRKAGDRLRANVQLVSVATGAPIWARTFDERFTEIFAVEDAISERVAEALTTRLSGEERSGLRQHPTESSEAYRLYLNGRWYADRLTRDSLTQALESLQQAVALDPHFALGYSGLAYHFVQCADLTIPSREAHTRAEEAARRALEIDPSLVEAHAVIGTVRFFRDYDRDACLRAFENAHSHHLYGWCLVLMGEFDRGLRALHAMQELDPYAQANTVYIAPALYFARRYDESLAVLRTQADPQLWLTHVITGRCLEAQGDLEGAIRSYEDSRRVDDSVPESLADLGRASGRAGRTFDVPPNVPSWVTANIHLGRRDYDRVFEFLNRMIDERSWYAVWLRIDPQLDELREDARFAKLLERV